jgi:hypothetical protein
MWKKGKMQRNKKREDTKSKDCLKSLFEEFYFYLLFQNRNEFLNNLKTKVKSKFITILLI